MNDLLLLKMHLPGDERNPMSVARKFIDADEVRNMLRIAAQVEGSQKKLADRLRLDTGYLSRVINGALSPCHSSVMEFLGLEKVETYRRRDGGLL